MKRTRSIEISVEREQVVRVRRLATLATRWCPECRNDVEMLTLEEAMEVLGATWQEVVGRVESQGIHSTETADGGLLICINSLLV